MERQKSTHFLQSERHYLGQDGRKSTNAKIVNVNFYFVPLKFVLFKLNLASSLGFLLSGNISRIMVDLPVNHELTICKPGKIINLSIIE